MATKKKPTIEEIVEEQTSEASEQPVETLEAVETAVEQPEEIVVLEADVAPEPPQFVVAGEQDSYPALAERLAPAGVRPRDFAQTLIQLNNGAPVRPGARIRIHP
jgi:hypothetical protein